MTLPMFAAALDTAAVGAMVSVVGSYTLEALMDSELRAQHKQQCAERLMVNDGRQVQYSEQAILANLDWGIDSLEEAIAANNDGTKTARLDHAEKMLQVCALLDSRASTAEIPNCYLSAWAHFNLAFVWKLRDDDRKAANHMLEMFLVDPFYGRVDFAPALWEHLFLPHLLNIVTWYTKQRQSIVVSGTSRKMTEEYEMSLSMSRDFTGNSNDVQVNVLNLSADQTSQLQALEKVYQDSLDENTRQYARYYKDWLNYDMANKKGMPLMPIAEPPTTPMADTWVPPSHGMPLLPKDQVHASTTGSASTVAGPHFLGNQDNLSTSSSRHSSLREPLNEFKDFVNLEFVESAKLPTLSGDGLQDEPDSPNSNFRRPGREFQTPVITKISTQQSESAQSKVFPASTDQGTPSPPKPSRTSVVSSGTATPASVQEEIRTYGAEGTLGGIANPCVTSIPHELESSTQRRRFSPSSLGTVDAVSDTLDYNPGASNPKRVEKKYSELRDSPSSNPSSRRMSLDDPPALVGRRVPRVSTSSSRYSSSESQDGKLYKRAESGRQNEPGLGLRSAARHPSDSLGRSNKASPAGSSEESVVSLRASPAIPEADSSNDSSDLDVSGARIEQDPTLEPGQNRIGVVPRYHQDGAAESEREDNRRNSTLSFRYRSETGCTPLPGVESPSKNSASARDHGDDRIDIRSERHRRSQSPGSIPSSISNSATATPSMRPPKDFVCPITSQLFNDPVTLETGQTYERKAIQEWLNRGNATCPITRQTLEISGLPKTNYVLKRLVDGWKEQYPELAMEFGSSPLLDDAATVRSGSPEKSISPVSSTDSPGSGRHGRRLSQRMLSNNNFNDRSRRTSPEDTDGLVMDLKPALNHLCTSENLAECESVILEIARFLQQSRGDQEIVAILDRTGAIAGMMELLFNSQQVTVLNATLFLLCILVTKDDGARQTVISADPEVGCLIGLLKTGLPSSVSLLYHLKFPIEQLASLDLLPLLVVVMKETEDDQGGDGSNAEQDFHSSVMRPKSAAIILLDEIVSGGDQTTFSQNTKALLALQVVPTLISSLDQTKHIGVRTSLVSLLLCCTQSNGRSRNTIAKMTNLAAVVDLLHSGNNRARTVAIAFLNDIVHLNSRALSTGILQKLKTEGNLSSMRVLLVYLQMAPLEHRPVAASLLLQLDLLEEPRKRSIYREEAVESLVEALTSGDWPCPVEAANALIGLCGRFSYSGKPVMKAWLLKIAGLEKYYLSLMKDEQESNEHSSQFDQEEEEKAAKVWERRVAGALVGHDLGTLIEALGQGIQSKTPEVSKPCMIVATWLTHLLPKLPDTGIRQTARNCLLDHFVGVLQTSKDLQQRVLAALAVHSFISDPEGAQELLSYVKDISGPLRQLKKATWTAKEILRSFATHVNANSMDIWVHAEQGQLDNTENGEVRALARAKSRIFSGHSDGTIKVWDAKKRFPVQLQEHKEHTKSVTALTFSPNSNRLYSGSLDKSIRVWALGPEDIQCLHVFDLKDAIVGLVVNGPMACIIPQGVGVKVQYEESATKLLNPNKHVHSLAISDGKIFCGCTDNSIQALDPISESVDVIQHGVRTLLGKKPIYATQVFQEHLYVAGAPVDGVAGKVWKLSDNSLVGTLCTPSEVRSMAVSEDFIYLGSSSGAIEVWLRERLLRVSTLNAGSKVISLMLDGDTLYSGSEDGKIRVSNYHLYEKSFDDTDMDNDLKRVTDDSVSELSNCMLAGDFKNPIVYSRYSEARCTRSAIRVIVCKVGEGSKPVCNSSPVTNVTFVWSKSVSMSNARKQCPTHVD